MKDQKFNLEDRLVGFAVRVANQNYRNHNKKQKRVAL